jgi:hypothetical protein
VVCAELAARLACMQSWIVCADLGAVLGAGIHARMGALPGAGPALWAGEGVGGLTGSMRSQVPGWSLFVNPTVSGAAGSSNLVSMHSRAVSGSKIGSAKQE